MLLKSITLISAVLAVALALAVGNPWLLFSFTSFWLLGILLADILYVIADPRINFDSRI